MKKLITILPITMITLSAWLLSCSKNNETDDCGPFVNRFKSSGITLNTLKIESFDSLSGRYVFDTLFMSDTVQYKKLALQLLPQKNFYIGSEIPRRCNYSFFNEAYACSPPIPYSDEQNDYIIITGTKDFDQAHKSGENLADLFDVAVLDLNKNIMYSRLSLSSYLALHPNTKDELILFLNEAPEQAGIFIFNIRYGRTLVTEQKEFVAASTAAFIDKD